MQSKSAFTLTPLSVKTMLGAAVLICSSWVSGCGDAASDKSPVAQITDKATSQTEVITLKDFETEYLKNNGSNIEAARKDSLKAYQDFLDRYVNFKLKVKDAYKAGLDKDPEILSELRQYRESLAQPYLTEKEVFEKEIRDLYEKRKEERKVSHILTLASATASPADTLKAYNKIMEALGKIRAGERFDSVAVKYSEDPSVKQNFGYLGYHSGGVFVHQFEDAMYATPVDSVSLPVRTRFGYHLVKVSDRRPRTMDIKASHILIRLSEHASAADSLAAYSRIKAIYNLVRQPNTDFAVVAKDSSEDKGSAVNGGDLGYFNYGRMIRPFEDSAFALKNVGDISGIVRTSFGFHLIKLTDRKKQETLDESREDLKRIIKRNSEKVDYDTDQLIARLKNKYQFKLDDAALTQLATKLDSATTPQNIKNLKDVDNQVTLFSFAGRTYTVRNFTNEFLPNYTQAGAAVLTEKSLKNFANKYARQEVLNYEISQLEVNYDEFAKLMSDYREGILLFKVSENNVWSKANNPPDSVLRAYFNQAKNDYTFGDRVAISEIVVTNKSNTDQLYAELTSKKRTLDVLTQDDADKEKARLAAERKKLSKKDKAFKAKSDSLAQRIAAIKADDQPRSFEKLADLYSEKLTDTLRTGYVGLFSKGEMPEADKVFGQKPLFITPPFELEGRFTIVRLDRVEQPRAKTFDEAKAELSSKYQESTAKKLEEAWLKTLRDASIIQTFPQTLEQAFKPHGN
jgi:peptidyl-prolyl cis-trans isomerase SurA